MGGTQLEGREGTGWKCTSTTHDAPVVPPLWERGLDQTPRSEPVLSKIVNTAPSESSMSSDSFVSSQSDSHSNSPPRQRNAGLVRSSAELDALREWTERLEKVIYLCLPLFSVVSQQVYKPSPYHDGGARSWPCTALYVQELRSFDEDIAMTSVQRSQVRLRRV